MSSTESFLFWWISWRLAFNQKYVSNEESRCAVSAIASVEFFLAKKNKSELQYLTTYSKEVSLLLHDQHYGGEEDEQIADVSKKKSIKVKLMCAVRDK